MEPPSSPKIPICLYRVLAGVLSLRITEPRANTSLSLPSAKEVFRHKPETSGLGCPGMHTSWERGLWSRPNGLHATWGQKSLWGLP